jgi:hypothetical protein
VTPFWVIDANRDQFRDYAIIDFRILELGAGKRIWNLANDVLDSIHAGNPHADSLGHADVWGYYALPAAHP